MIYGDNPQKINESLTGPDDPQGLNTYTYLPGLDDRQTLDIYGLSSSQICYLRQIVQDLQEVYKIPEK